MVVSRKNIQHIETKAADHFAQLLEQYASRGLMDKIQLLSAEFIGRPYTNGALGEGPSGRFDQYPLYRNDSFDCMTYVNTVLSLALCSTLGAFVDCLAKLAYNDGVVDYLSRHHFVCMQWNAANARRGFIRDITEDMAQHVGVSALCDAVVNIDRSNWYTVNAHSAVRLYESVSMDDVQRYVQLLVDLTRDLPVVSSAIRYIPLRALSSASVERQCFFKRIPSGSIIEIVRPGWEIASIIGTPLHVCHMGFLIHDDGGTFFRHASQQYARVVDENCGEYFDAWLLRDSNAGINIQVTVV